MSGKYLDHVLRSLSLHTPKRCIYTIVITISLCLVKSSRLAPQYAICSCMIHNNRTDIPTSLCMKESLMNQTRCLKYNMPLVIRRIWSFIQKYSIILLKHVPLYTIIKDIMFYIKP